MAMPVHNPGGEVRGSQAALWGHGVAITLVALLATQLLHEATHAGVGLLFGAETVLLSVFAAYIEPVGLAQWQLVTVAVSAPIINVLVGVLAFASSRHVGRRAPWWSATLLLVAGFSLLTGFGYAMVDPVTYRPGAPGDLAVLLDAVGGSLAWRIGLFIVGTAGWLTTMFLVAIELWRFEHQAVSRTRLAAALLVLPYLLAIALLVPAAGWLHPLGGDGATVVFLQYVFGTSALLTGFFLSTRWLTYRPPPQRVVLPAGFDLTVCVLGGIALGLLAITLNPIALR